MPELEGLDERTAVRQEHLERYAEAYGGYCCATPPTGIGRAMAAITLGGGGEGESQAVEVLRGYREFEIPITHRFA